MGIKKIGNYRIFLFSSSIAALAGGIFAPFWIIFIQEFGSGIEQFGFAIGLMAVAQSITAYYSGKYSDKLGRMPILITSSFTSAAVIFAYTLIGSIFQLYILQVLMGVTVAMGTSSETAFLGDVTKKASRGLHIGKYQAIVGIIAGLAMMGGGYIAGQMGITIVFYITSALIVLSTIPLFYIKE